MVTVPTRGQMAGQRLPQHCPPPEPDQAMVDGTFVGVSSAVKGRDAMTTRMTEKKMGMSTMSRRIAGPLVAVLLAAGAVTGTGAAQAAGPASGPGWHDGACAANEGQTVVVDFSKDPKHQSPAVKGNWPGKEGVLVRCNVGGDWANPGGDARMEPLKAAGITYVPDAGLIHTIDGVTDDPDLGVYWMFSSAISGTKWDTGVVPKPGKNTWVGVTLGGQEIPSIDPPVKK